MGEDTVSIESVEDVAALAEAIRGEIGKAVVGQEQTVDILLVALFAGGHVLLEGSPGTAKTLLARSFARVTGLDFGRIQFTPDLMPGDIIGANLFNFQTSSFTLTRGPIFTDLLLADEINRTPPKTQAALLEAMQERTVTIDGESLSLGDRFMVVATQNPIEQQGVYPLPEAQLDRFLFKQIVDYPSAAEERRIVAAHGSHAHAMEPAEWGVARVADAVVIGDAIAMVAQVRLADEVIDYITALIRGTRDVADLETGASPRAGAMLAGAARARAALDGRDFVLPDDVKALAPALLRHRLILSPAAEIDGRAIEDVVTSIIEAIEAPR
jgi:MoxR-like ATPase